MNETASQVAPPEGGGPVDGKPVKASKSRLAVRAAVLVLVVAALLLFGRRVAAYLPEFTAWVDGLGVWGRWCSWPATPLPPLPSFRVPC